MKFSYTPILDNLTQNFNLEYIKILDFHPNSFIDTKYSYISGYKNFFDPIYSERVFSQIVFSWKHSDKIFGVAIEPIVDYIGGYPKLNHQKILNELEKFIKQSVDIDASIK